MREILIDWLINVGIPVAFTGLLGSLVWMMLAFNQTADEYSKLAYLETPRKDAEHGEEAINNPGTCGWYLDQTQRHDSRRNISREKPNGAHSQQAFRSASRGAMDSV